MFFVMGITDGRKDIDFAQTVICDNCGKYGRYQVFMLYTVLSLFFIPTFKWNKRYYVQMSCCGTVYELNPEIGRRIAAGEDLQIRPEDITKVNQGRNYGLKHCNNCGYETAEDFEFCPKCGMHF
ncbi:MAG: zinc ribbon domain-containing protein [Pseudobutyrivibrio sp.]|nr:zinc ribbon domain-containing protein [Pseudobutyrivibrio sp.]